MLEFNVIITRNKDILSIIMEFVDWRGIGIHVLEKLLKEIEEKPRLPNQLNGDTVTLL